MCCHLTLYMQEKDRKRAEEEAENHSSQVPHQPPATPQEPSPEVFNFVEYPSCRQLVSNYCRDAPCLLFNPKLHTILGEIPAVWYYVHIVIFPLTFIHKRIWLLSYS